MARSHVVMQYNSNSNIIQGNSNTIQYITLWCNINIHIQEYPYPYPNILWTSISISKYPYPVAVPYCTRITYNTSNLYLVNGAQSLKRGAAASTWSMYWGVPRYRRNIHPSHIIWALLRGLRRGTHRNASQHKKIPVRNLLEFIECVGKVDDTLPRGRLTWLVVRQPRRYNLPLNVGLIVHRDQLPFVHGL